MRFPGIRLVEQTEQNFRFIRDCLEEKKRATVKVGLFYHKKRRLKTTILWVLKKY